MILIIDNYDSFVHNLARYVEIAGAQTRVIRNNKISVQEIAQMKPRGIIISPGPCTPKEAGVSVELIKALAPSTPILGVCLGHQAIGEAFGGKTVRSEPMHGEACEIEHDGAGLFQNLPSPLKVGRYHSLVSKLPKKTPLEITARYEGIIMAMQHSAFPCYGVQFHPESILTEHGQQLIENFLTIADDWQTRNAT